MYRRAFTIIDMAIVLTVIVIIVSAAVPQYFKSRNNAHEAACATNRRVLDDAEQLAMLQTWLSRSDGIDIDDLVPGYISKLPTCDEGGSYTLNGQGEPSSCSIHGPGGPKSYRVDDGGSPRVAVN